MNDADRIRALRDEGRIDDAQAERLLRALDAIAAEQAPADAHADAPADATAATDAPSDPKAAAAPTQAPPPAAPSPGPATPGAAGPGPATPPTRAADPAREAAREPARGPAGEPPPATETLADVDRWTSIELFACAVQVEVDPTLQEPVVDARQGDIRLEASEGGWRVAQGGPREGTWLERLVDGVRGTRLHLRLPPRTGVALDVKAGDVEMDGVPALRGRLMAGDLDARGLRAVDVAVNAGDLDLGLDPAPGLHRVRLSVGDAELHLPDSADVRVEAEVAIGDASASAPFGSERRGMVAEHVEGVMGEGRATLRIEVGTGDLDVKVDRDGR
jgi:hypothetical protein